MNRRFVALILASLMAGTAAAETVATASSVNGSVMVNQGDKFLPLSAGQPLSPGDRIMVADKSSAIVTYNDGCPLSISAETMVTLPSTSTCAGGIAQTQRIAPTNTGAVGTPYPPETDWTAFWIVVGPVIAIDAWAIHEGDDEFTSP
ncbi:hypothetical protein [Arenimonas oryziterrae]|uniref:Uncharacterized protein n=1 Tax=Arenimonas oryziterrae DSM 21050 = YC6267 TaxID=1121015 RepID=A0A091B2H9_9GAMM|nr:hypothetical protein [Arenimonas oryziterrae]KFN45089.1 hypothetical protein N789_03440 [Arenimonas oryziterrae DSM 21050 = YC6267]